MHLKSSHFLFPGLLVQDKPPYAAVSLSLKCSKKYCLDSSVCWCVQPVLFEQRTIYLHVFLSQLVRDSAGSLSL